MEIPDEERAGSAHVQVVTRQHLCNNTRLQSATDFFFFNTGKELQQTIKIHDRVTCEYGKWW